MDLKCEWRGCESSWEGIESLSRHFKDHLNHLNHLDTLYSSDDVGTRVLLCEWSDCVWETQSSSCHTLCLHAAFHPYHCYLKEMGRIVAEKRQLGTCTLGRLTANDIPDVNEIHTCRWNDCNRTFYCPHQYYCHVEDHALFEEPEEDTTLLKCGWQDCHTEVKTKYKLRDHCSVHTHKKAMACPTCGGLFANATKLKDHFARQASFDEGCFQCSHCLKRLSSERLLRDHMSQHVNKYKCLMCPMTCPSPSALKRHVKHRHSEDRPHLCDLCSYSCKTAHDLKRHRETHSLAIAYRCSECSYYTRALQCLRNHYRRVHECPDMVHPYQCHACHMCFLRGAALSNHLIEVHNFQLPPGHARFRYQEDEQGVYHLQTVRFESTQLEHDHDFNLGQEEGSVLNLTGQEVEACHTQALTEQPLAQLVLLHGLVMSDSQESVSQLYANGAPENFDHSGLLIHDDQHRELLTSSMTTDRRDLSNDHHSDDNGENLSTVALSHLEGFADRRNLQLLSEACCSLSHLPGETASN